MTIGVLSSLEMTLFIPRAPSETAEECKFNNWNLMMKFWGEKEHKNNKNAKSIYFDSWGANIQFKYCDHLR